MLPTSYVSWPTSICGHMIILTYMFTYIHTHVFIYMYMYMYMCVCIYKMERERERPKVTKIRKDQRPPPETSTLQAS